MAKEENAFAGITAEQLQLLLEDDAFLTDLSLGRDSSKGRDELAALFLELRRDVERPMPPAPRIEGAEEEPAVISLTQARKRQKRNRPVTYGLIGAAAATVVLAGSAAAVLGAPPGSLLYGLQQTLLGPQHTNVVELASTLDEMESRAAQGDMAGTRELLEEARTLVNAVRGEHISSPKDIPPTPAKKTLPRIVTETVTASAEQTPAPSAAPTTVTVTVREKVTTTVTVPAATATGTATAEPTSTSTSTPPPTSTTEPQPRVAHK